MVVVGEDETATRRALATTLKKQFEKGKISKVKDARVRVFLESCKCGPIKEVKMEHSLVRQQVKGRFILRL